MDYKIVVSDRYFNVIEEIQDIASNISWDYNRVGGCGSFKFDVPIRFCEETFLGGNFNVKIYRKNPTTRAYDLWYQGRIEDKIHNVQGVNEKISIQGSGYQSQLKDIIVNSTFTSQEISTIVTDVLDDDIVPNTDITYSGGDITATSFTPDSIDFNDKDGLDVFQTLADITGSREWGVDKDRKFFFKQRSSSVGLRFPLGSDGAVFSNDTSSHEIVNRVKITGGDVGGTPFTATYNDTASQNKWKRRDKAIQNSSIVTSQVASQYADAIFAEFRDVVTRGKLDLLKEQLIESTIPIPLLQVIAKGITWGTEKWGTFLYSGLVSYQVSRINYSLDEVGNLKIGLQLGQLRPNVAEDLNQLEYKIDQIRQTI